MWLLNVVTDFTTFAAPAVTAVSTSPLSIAVVLLLAILLKKLLFSSSGKDKLPPQVQHRIPFIGKALEFGSAPLALLKGGYKKFGDCFRFTIFGETIVCLVGAEGGELFFKAREDELSANQAYQFTVPVFGKGVVYDVEPRVLVQQRKFVHTGLSPRRFAAYVPLIEKEAKDYFDAKWGDEGTCDFFDAISEVVVVTSTRCLHGKEIRENVHAEFAKLYQQLDDALSPIGFFFPNLPLPAMIGRDKARKAFVEMFSGIIKKRRESGESHEDMLQTFMDATYDDGRKLADDEIVGMLIALMIAGQHTSKVTGTWMGFFLLDNLELLKRAYDEQAEVLGEPAGSEKKWKELDLALTKQMNFLENCMREALRLRPPIIMIMRRVMKDLEYKGYTIPKGALACASPALTHRLKEYYPNPNQFDPDRFAEPRAEHRAGPFRYLAFGAGNHACSGEGFAFVQVKTIWSYLLRNYELEKVQNMPEADFTTMIPGPKHPCLIKYRRRK